MAMILEALPIAERRHLEVDPAVVALRNTVNDLFDRVVVGEPMSVGGWRIGLSTDAERNTAANSPLRTDTMFCNSTRNFPQDDYEPDWIVVRRDGGTDGEVTVGCQIRGATAEIKMNKAGMQQLEPISEVAAKYGPIDGSGWRAIDALCGIHNGVKRQQLTRRVIHSLGSLFSWRKDAPKTASYEW